MTQRISDIAFTNAVKAQQTRLGSRDMNESQMQTRDWPTEVTENLAAFLAQRDSFYMATVSETGHPYIQHRGGPKGFLKVVDPKTLGFADLSGNRQYISTGNLDGSDKVHLFLMDYGNKQRIKLWGRARVVEDDPDLLDRLAMPETRVKAERAILIAVDAWDINCPQHIPELYSDEVVRQVAAKMTQRIAALEAENAELRQWMGDQGKDTS
ncbi:MAG: pyridoxamine 5'-phosphate oxidase family protein [Pseudomonadota bacterium]